MAKKKENKPEEVVEAEDTLRSMVSSLNELPTDTLQQLLDNLNEIERYNQKHHLTSGSSHGEYAIAGLEEVLELNDFFLSICLLHEYVKTRMIREAEPLQAILLFQAEEDVHALVENLDWLKNFVNPKSRSAEEKEGFAVVHFVSDWDLHGELFLVSAESLEKGLPDELANHLRAGCRVSLCKPGYDEAYFRSLLK